MKKTAILAFCGLSLATASLTVIAQDENSAPVSPGASAPATTPENRGGSRDSRRPSMEDFRQRMNERLKTSLKMNDEEWAAVQPLIENVQSKQREMYSGGRSSSSRRGGDRGREPGSSEAARTPRPGAEESDKLRAALENEGSSPDELKARLTALRDQRKKSAAELAEAREQLRQVLTLRQEATLVSMGLLD